jgi:hypothetical protein
METARRFQDLLVPRALLAQRTQSSLLWIAFNLKLPDLKLPLLAATNASRLYTVITPPLHSSTRLMFR